MPPHRWSPDEARAQAQRANSLRWSRYRAAIAAGARPSPIRLPPTPATPSPLADPRSYALTIAQAQHDVIACLDRLREAAAAGDAETAERWARAAERAWSILAHAAQVPQPPRADRDRRGRTEPMTLDIAPVAEATQAQPVEPTQPQPAGDVMPVAEASPADHADTGKESL